MYGKRKAMYDSISRITFSMKHDTIRQQRFQIYGEEEYTEVSERKILRAIRSTRVGLLSGCSNNF